MRRRLLALWVVVTVTLTSSAAWAASEIWLPNGSVPDPLTSAPQKLRPVLFVHGHNPDDASDADFNYRKNWVDAVDGLPSFQHSVRSTVTLGQPTLRVGDPLAMRVQVLVGGRPLTNASRVVVTVLGPGESSAKQAPRVVRLDYRGDGVFAGTFRDTKIPGPYRLVVAIEGRDARIGDFQRSASTTAVVQSSRSGRPATVAPKEALR